MLEGKIVRLVVLEESHLDDIMKGWNNPEMRIFLGGFVPHTRTAEKEWIETAQQQMKNMSAYYFVIEDLSTSRFIGTLSIGNINWISKTSGFGIAIHSPQDWDKGYGTEATQLCLDFAWTHLNLRRIELSVYAFNERAKHVYEKLGFKEWGVAHRKWFVNGEYRDVRYMEIFRETE